MTSFIEDTKGSKSTQHFQRDGDGIKFSFKNSSNNNNNNNNSNNNIEMTLATDKKGLYGLLYFLLRFLSNYFLRHFPFFTPFCNFQDE